MHTGPVHESDGDFSGPMPTECHCRKCDAPLVSVQLWESKCGGYEDYKYTCAACGHVWWIEGIDS